MEVCLNGQLTEHVRNHAEEGSGQDKGHATIQPLLMVGETVLAPLQKPNHAKTSCVQVDIVSHFLTHKNKILS